MTLRNVHVGTDVGQDNVLDTFRYIFDGFDVLVNLDTPPVVDSVVDHFIKTQLHTRPELHFDCVHLVLMGEEQVMLFVPKELRLTASLIALIKQCDTSSFNGDPTAYLINADMTNDAERALLFEILKTVNKDNTVVARVTGKYDPGGVAATFVMYDLHQLGMRMFHDWF